MRRIIFSVYQDNLDHNENLTNYLKVAAKFKSIGTSFKFMLGAYKGKKEASFEVFPITRWQLGEIIRIATEYNQECVLDLYSNEARLLYLASGSSERIGQWKEVDEAYALKQKAYSLDAETGKYYVVE